MSLRPEFERLIETLNRSSALLRAADKEGYVNYAKTDNKTYYSIVSNHDNTEYVFTTKTKLSIILNKLQAELFSSYNSEQNKVTFNPRGPYMILMAAITKTNA
jgi:hypothetical protein